MSASVFDSGFMLGDGVWEGIRMHGGRFAFLDRHFDRLWRGAKARWRRLKGPGRAGPTP